MDTSGTLWELLRFCLLLYDQSSKLKDIGCRIAGQHGMAIIPSGWTGDAYTLFDQPISIVIVVC